MRIKLAILILILTSLACTANVSTFNSPTSNPPTESPTVQVELTSAPGISLSLDSQPLVTPEAISSIHMLDANNGWIITDHAILRTRDGGTTWHNVTPSNVSALGFGIGFSFLDSNRGWIIVSDQSDPINQGVMYHTVDGGLSWTAVATPFGGALLKFFDDNNAWAMVYAGVATGNMNIKFFQTANGGTNWTEVFETDPNNADVEHAIPFAGIKSGFTPVNMQEAWVSGQTYATNDFYLYETLDGGHTWSKVNYQMPFTGEAMYLTQPPVFFDSQNGILPMTAGSEGVGTLFLKTQDGGATWTAGAPIPGAGMYSVPTYEDVFVWFGNELSVSHDGGATWSAITPNIQIEYGMLQIQFIDSQTGWLITSAANGHTGLYKTQDGGQTWNVQV